MKWFKEWRIKRVQARKNSVDLRHFNEVSFTDAWDGQTTCSDGWNTDLVLYRDRVVVRKMNMKADGATEHRSSVGSDFWKDMHAVANVYMRIVHIARQKYFNEDPLKGINWDVVWLSDEIRQTLLAHPQYQEATRQLGITLEPRNENRWRVNSRRHLEAA